MTSAPTLSSDLATAKAAQPPPSTSFYAAAHAASAARAEAAEATVSAAASSIASRLTSPPSNEGGGGGTTGGGRPGLQRRNRGPPRCWPFDRSAAALLRRVDAEARSRGRRCVMWDDSGRDGFCCWVRWDWEKGEPLMMTTTKEEGEDGEEGEEGEEEEEEENDENVKKRRRKKKKSTADVTDASWWEVLCRSLGPPLTPREALRPSEVGAWLDAHTMRVHGWGEEDEGEDQEVLGGRGGEEKIEGRGRR